MEGDSNRGRQISKDDTLIREEENIPMRSFEEIILRGRIPAIDGENPGKQSRQTNISLQSHLPTHGRRFENTEQDFDRIRQWRRDDNKRQSGERRKKISIGSESRRQGANLNYSGFNRSREIGKGRRSIQRRPKIPQTQHAKSIIQN
ncbi:hypothetical protein YC2023_015509 [Brassica napus]